MAIHPVVLCGGVGSRLWPLSQPSRPKQFLPLAGPESLLVDTLRRVDGAGFAAPVLVANEDHRFIVAEQMRSAGLVPAAIILEPAGRGTAPAIGLAALTVMARDPDGILLVMPSDHAIADTGAFAAALATAGKAAVLGELVTFGIAPDRPETGYGYIRAGAPHPAVPGCARVAAFIEKPDRVTAEALVAEGGHAWNSGIFLFRADAVVGELHRLRPDIVAALRKSLRGAAVERDFLRPDARAFAACPQASIDTAVMEQTDKAVMVPVDMGWSDLGDWAAVWALAPKDDAGNAVRGDAVVVGSANCHVHSEDGILAALVGVEDLVVAATGDAVLVARRDHVQDVKAVVEALKAQNMAGEGSCTASSIWPWGQVRSIAQGHRFRVRHLTIAPGASLGTHFHYHRAEHWVIVDGTARVTRGEDSVVLAVNESACVPPGEVHRLENPGVLPLVVIEVQTGAYLGEDDVERVGDDDRRAETLSRNQR